MGWISGSCNTKLRSKPLLLQDPSTVKNLSGIFFICFATILIYFCFLFLFPLKCSLELILTTQTKYNVTATLKITILWYFVLYMRMVWKVNVNGNKILMHLVISNKNYNFIKNCTKELCIGILTLQNYDNTFLGLIIFMKINFWTDSWGKFIFKGWQHPFYSKQSLSMSL